MPEVVINVPEDLARVPRVELSLFINRLLKEKLERIVWLEKGLQKSKLTKEKADDIADRISEGLAKKYIESGG